MSSLQKERPVSTNEREFLLTALKAEQRLDGRGPTASRRATITLGTAPGDVEVSMGGTSVTAAVSADLVEPHADRPQEGLLSFGIDFSPMASPFFEPGRASLKSVEVSRLVERCVKDAGALDTETLCVLAGSKVWSVRVDVRVTNYEGNMTDCCALAAVAALRTFRRPDVTVVGTSVTVHPVEEQPPVPLALHHTPITNTFAYFADADAMVLDPSLPEDLTADATITVAMNSAKEVCALQKAGGVPVSKELLNSALVIAHKRTLELSAALDAVIEERKKADKHQIFADPAHAPTAVGSSAAKATK